MYWRFQTHAYILHIHTHSASERLVGQTVHLHWHQRMVPNDNSLVLKWECTGQILRLSVPFWDMARQGMGSTSSIFCKFGKLERGASMDQTQIVHPGATQVNDTKFHVWVLLLPSNWELIIQTTHTFTYAHWQTNQSSSSQMHTITCP